MIADLSAAACLGVEPALFDEYRFPEANLAIWYCQRCPVVDTCMDTVRPSKSFFDGVAGGIVWRNGYRVRADNSTREDRIKQRKGEQ